MMIMTTPGKQKFPKRRGSYYYYLGEKFVSVTNVLQMLAKPALITWAAKTASALVLDDPERYDTVQKAVGGLYAGRDDAGERGTEAHSIADHYATKIWQQKDVSVTDQVFGSINPYRPGIESFFNIMHPDVLFSEVNVYSRKHGYAGTSDLIAEIGGDVWLVDWKTSKAVYPDMALQLAAYANAEFILEEGKEIDIPKIDKTAVVLLKADGTFQWTPLFGDFEVFLALRKVWDWNEKN